MTADFIDDCIARALRHDSGLDAGVLEVPGFSTGVMRRLWNNLAARSAVYLEVGAYFGGTACAVINNKPTLAYIYEDGSQEFHGRPILPDLHANLAKHGSANWELREEDFFARPALGMPDVDFFFYDGNHDYEYQARALAHAFPALHKRFLFAVDDYNWDSVNTGTFDGMHALGDLIGDSRQWILKGEQPNDDPVWHNGVALFLCDKI